MLWGATDLRPWFPPPPERTGEVWFFGPDGSSLPLLVKFIFVTAQLSVQVHPPDDYAALHEGCLGKTEMWYVLRAEPGARIGVGLREPISGDRLREVALNGEIEGMLAWHQVQPGDVFYIPAGTIHTLGAGVTLCEVQQQSDLTYRLYDYGRPRELHLEKALAVANLEPHPGKSAPHETAAPVARLVESPYFITDLMQIDSARLETFEPRRGHILLFFEGEGRLDGEVFQAGEAWLIPEEATRFRIEPAGTVRLLRTWAPR